MSDPYRSEDQVAKLQAKIDELQKENENLMWRFSSLRRWPAYLFFGLMIGVIAFGSLRVFESVADEIGTRKVDVPFLCRCQ